MSAQVNIIRTYFKAISLLSPSFAAKQGIRVFSKVRIKKIKEKEKAFFSLAEKLEIPFKNHQPLHCYKMGNPNGKIIFLLHGWDSNIGSLTLFAKALAATNQYQIIGITMPAHGYHQEKRTNLAESSLAFKTVLDFFNPLAPFDVVAHSFGSGVTAMGLAISPTYKADKLVFLTTPNKIKNIFDEFKSIVKLGNKAYEKLLEYAEKDVLQEAIEQFTVSEKLNHANYNDLLIIHDEYDKILPFTNSEEIIANHSNIRIKKMQKIGHYRMLWNEDVVTLTMDFLLEKENL